MYEDLHLEVIYDEPQVVLELINNIETLGEVIGGGVAYTFLFPILEDALEYEEERVRKLVRMFRLRRLRSTMQ